jgi:hypothetical protein
MTWSNLGTETWLSWTPSVTSTGTNPSAFDGSSAHNRYKRAGDLVFVRFLVTNTNPGGVGDWRVSLPVAPKQVNDFTTCGDIYMWTPDRTIFGSAVLHTTSHSTSTIEMVPYIPLTQVGTVLPRFPRGAITTNYVHLTGRLFYEAA